MFLVFIVNIYIILFQACRIVPLILNK